MGKSMNAILFDFRKSNTQANKLDEIARKIRTEKNNLQRCKQLLSSSWKSDSYSIYARKVSAVEEELERIEKNLSKTSNTVRTIARNSYNAERQAYEIAKNRDKK